MSTSNPFDAYAPEELAQRVQNAGVRKAGLPLLPLLTLAVLAGAYIAFGGMFYTLVVTGAGPEFGPVRLLGGVAFSLGLILVVIGGAELFTGNTLIVMAWVDRKVSFAALMRNWSVAYVGNFVGALATAVMVWLSGTLMLGDGAVAATAVAIAEGKAALPPVEALFRGILCNVLVCLAVWLSFAAHDVVSRILAIVFPIAAFVALGFEHSVANMYLMPVGMLAGAEIDVVDILANLLPVTVGNIIGGGVFVALTYWIVYVRGDGPGV